MKNRNRKEKKANEKTCCNEKQRKKIANETDEFHFSKRKHTKQLSAQVSTHFRNPPTHQRNGEPAANPCSCLTKPISPQWTGYCLEPTHTHTQAAAQ